MAEQYIHTDSDSPWGYFWNTLAASWMGRRMGMRSRMRVHVQEDKKRRDFVLYMTPDQRILLQKALSSPVSLRSLGIPSHGALRNPDAADDLVRGLRRMRDRRRRSAGKQLAQIMGSTQRLETELNEIANEIRSVGENDLVALVTQLHQLLQIHEEGITLLHNQLELLLQENGTSDNTKVPKKESTDPVPSVSELVRDCRVIAGMIDALPETLNLPSNAPLRYMLEGEVNRLTRLLQELSDSPNERRIREVLEEFVRIEEVLHSDLASSPYLEGQESALLPFTSKLQQFCRRYSAFCMRERQ